VLDLIVKDDDNNNFVEGSRGKNNADLFSDPVDAHAVEVAEGIAEDSDAPEAPDCVVDDEDE
jgi:hypothetical protein